MMSDTILSQNPNRDLQKQLHEAELNNLLHFYATVIVNNIKKQGGKRNKDKYRVKRLEKELGERLDSKECCRICNKIRYSYADSVVYRHAEQVYFGKRLMDLDYRYCKDCKRLMPKSIILAQESDSRKARRIVSTAILCPCCRKRTVLAKVLIRKTKMGPLLFKEEGY